MTGALPDALSALDVTEHGPGAPRRDLRASAVAMVWEGDGRFRAVEAPLPALAPGESLVRITAATVCGSDRHTVSGRRSSPCPSVLGHEGVGIVVATEDGLCTSGRTLAPGDRVVFGVTASCGRCQRCRRGLTAKCLELVKAGHEAFDGPWPLSGTYATHILLKAGQAVARVPAALADGPASTAGCAVATVMAMLERAGDLSGRRVLVNGIGMLGLVAVAAARSRGASEVCAVDPSPGRRRRAARLGATVLSPDDVPDSVDVALELSGAPAGVRACLDSLDIGGTAVLAGSVAPAGEVGLDPEQLVRGWQTVAGVHNYEPRHLAEAVDFLVSAGDVLPWEDILDGPIGLSDLEAEFSRTASSGLRTVVVP